MKKISMAIVFIALFVVGSFAAVVVKDFNWTASLTITAIQAVPTTDGKTAILMNTSSSGLFVFFMSDVGAAQMYDVATQALNTGKSVNFWSSSNAQNQTSVSYLGWAYPALYAPCCGISKSR